MENPLKKEIETFLKTLNSSNQFIFFIFFFLEKMVVAAQRPYL